MKKAHYTWTGKPYGNRTETAHATVTLKDDGKVSISIMGTKHLSYAAKYGAKALGQAIVAADFKHEAITDMYVSEAKEGVKEKLMEETAELLADLLARTEIYATKQWAEYERENARTSEEWRAAFRVTTSLSKQYGSMERRRDKVRNEIRKGFEKFRAEEMDSARRHHADCVSKLAHRLTEKGLVDLSDLTMTKGRIGVNLEMEFSFKGIIVYARTIIAEGPIVRAHYRYLIN